LPEAKLAELSEAVLVSSIARQQMALEMEFQGVRREAVSELLRSGLRDVCDAMPAGSGLCEMLRLNVDKFESRSTRRGRPQTASVHRPSGVHVQASAPVVVKTRDLGYEAAVAASQAQLILTLPIPGIFCERPEAAGPSVPRLRVREHQKRDTWDHDSTSTDLDQLERLRRESKQFRREMASRDTPDLKLLRERYCTAGIAAASSRLRRPKSVDCLRPLPPRPWLKRSMEVCSKQQN
jgi:hypothetical protein